MVLNCEILQNELSKCKEDTSQAILAYSNQMLERLAKLEIEVKELREKKVILILMLI